MSIFYLCLAFYYDFRKQLSRFSSSNNKILTIIFNFFVISSRSRGDDNFDFSFCAVKNYIEENFYDILLGHILNKLTPNGRMSSSTIT
jgi:hypothetical protein